MWQERWEGWTESGRRERCVQVCQRIWATVDTTTYVELLEREQLEVRIVEHGGAYAKAVYYAHRQALTEQHVRRITSTLQRIDAPSDIDGNGNAD
jgi:hypothetical protein